MDELDELEAEMVEEDIAKMEIPMGKVNAPAGPMSVPAQVIPAAAEEDADAAELAALMAWVQELSEFNSKNLLTCYQNNLLSYIIFSLSHILLIHFFFASGSLPVDFFDFAAAAAGGAESKIIPILPSSGVASIIEFVNYESTSPCLCGLWFDCKFEFCAFSGSSSLFISSCLWYDDGSTMPFFGFAWTLV